MKKIILLVILMFIGCGDITTNIPYKESGAIIEGSKIYEMCMPNGVVYYATGTFRLAPKFNKNNKVEICNPNAVFPK